MDQALSPVVRILTVAGEMAGDEQRAAIWFKHQPIPGWGGKTAYDLVAERKADKALAYLEAVRAGRWTSILPCRTTPISASLSRPLPGDARHRLGGADLRGGSGPRHDPRELFFAIAQFLAYFKWTKIGEVMAITGAERLATMNVHG